LETGWVRSILFLTAIPDCIVDDITGYLESFWHRAIKERTDRERRAGALETA
jgi:hypothetical protein